MGDFNTASAIEALDLGGDHLEHFGVKGMHWGVIRDKVGGHVEARAQEKARVSAPHPEYNPAMRRHDRLRFSEGSIKKINKNMHEGLDHKAAVKKEEERVKVRNRIVTGVAVTAVLLQQFGPLVMHDIHVKAATNRDKRAQATEDFIKNGPQKPATKNAKKSFRGVYNVTTM